MKRLTIVLFAIWVALAASAVSASLSIDIGGAEFSGSGANSIASDAITLLFEDSADDATIGANDIRLTINFNGGTGVDATAKINEITFNADPLAVVSGMTFDSGDIASPSIQPYSQNTYSSDGDRYYDFEIQFQTSGDTFDVDDEAVFTITGTGLTPSTFNFFSDPGNKGPFLAAAHINAVDDGDSGHYGGGEIPEPASVAVWAVIALLCTAVPGKKIASLQN